jgi:hypothetical protein
VTDLSNRDRSPFSTNSYAQITTCGTFQPIHRFGLAFPISSHIGGIAAHILGVLLAILSLVLGSAPIELLLLAIGAAEVLGMVAAPALVVVPLVLFATGLSGTGSLSLFESRVRFKQASTIRTSPSLPHVGLPTAVLLREGSSIGSNHNQDKKKRRKNSQESKEEVQGETILILKKEIREENRNLEVKTQNISKLRT